MHTFSDCGIKGNNNKANFEKQKAVLETIIMPLSEKETLEYQKYQFEATDTT
jgi:hypothetical protein